MWQVGDRRASLAECVSHPPNRRTLARFNLHPFFFFFFFFTFLSSFLLFFLLFWRPTSDVRLPLGVHTSYIHKHIYIPTVRDVHGLETVPGQVPPHSYLFADEGRHGGGKPRWSGFSFGFSPGARAPTYRRTRAESIEPLHTQPAPLYIYSQALNTTTTNLTG